MVFFISLYIGSQYTGGDQEFYRKVYAVLPTLGVVEGYQFFKVNLTSAEPGYYIIAWLFSRVLEKDIFVAIANTILAFVCMKIFLKWKASVYIASLIVLTNFYLYVLFFAAERLKFSFIFLAIAIIYVNHKRFYLFSALSLTAHAQTFILYMALLFDYFVVELKRVFALGRIKKPFLISCIGVFILLGFMYNQLETKFYSHVNENFDIMDTLRLSLFLLLAAFYSRKKLETVSLFIPLYVVAMIIGGDRVNLYGYFIFLYYALPINKGINMGILGTSIYFIFKNYMFIDNIFKFGNGFPR